MTQLEYQALRNTIEYHMDRYYNQDAPEIFDFEYDRLMQQLKAAEKEHPEWVDPDSPSQKVGGTVKREAGVKVTHTVPMLSIEDVFEFDRFIDQRCLEICDIIPRVEIMFLFKCFSISVHIAVRSIKFS